MFYFGSEKHTKNYICDSIARKACMEKRKELKDLSVPEKRDILALMEDAKAALSCLSSEISRVDVSSAWVRALSMSISGEAMHLKKSMEGQEDHSRPMSPPPPTLPKKKEVEIGVPSELQFQDG